MQLTAYVDESGTHGKIGNKAGAMEMLICGAVAPVEEWKSLTFKWQAALNKHGAEVFHFNDWSMAKRWSLRKDGSIKGTSSAKNPFKGWKSDQLNALLMDLAIIAGDGNKVLVQGSVLTDNFQAMKIAGQIAKVADPFAHCMDQFFSSVMATIECERAAWKKMPISFFFDQNEDPQWQAMLAASFMAHKKRHPQFKTYAYADKKSDIALQAADMIACRQRFHAGKWRANESPFTGSDMDWMAFDEALFKSPFNFLQKHQNEADSLALRGKLNPPKD